MKPPPRTQKRTRRAGWALVGVLLTLGAAAAVYSFLRPREVPAVAFPSAVGVRVGELAPDFRLTDTEGRVVTRASLLAGGKPGLVFFTATWCLPCVEGLRQLVRFQQDLGGGEAFRVLVVFVDPRETVQDVRAYRDQHGFPRTWFYAPDQDRMIWKYGVRFLDTKLVLDPQGVVRWVDVYPAGYDTWRRALATVGVRR